MTANLYVPGAGGVGYLLACYLPPVARRGPARLRLPPRSSLLKKTSREHMQGEDMGPDQGQARDFTPLDLPPTARYSVSTPRSQPCNTCTTHHARIRGREGASRAIAKRCLRIYQVSSAFGIKRGGGPSGVWVLNTERQRECNIALDALAGRRL